MSKTIYSHRMQILQDSVPHAAHQQPSARHHLHEHATHIHTHTHTRTILHLNVHIKKMKFACMRQLTNMFANNGFARPQQAFWQKSGYDRAFFWLGAQKNLAERDFEMQRQPRKFENLILVACQKKHFRVFCVIFRFFYSR